jgi:hypothetical protein
VPQNIEFNAFLLMFYYQFLANLGCREPKKVDKNWVRENGASNDRQFYLGISLMPPIIT